MCQGVVPTCQQTSCSPSQKPSGNFSVYQREGKVSGAKLGREQRCQAGEGQPHCPQPPLALGCGEGMGSTDRRRCFDGFHRSLKHLLRQPEVGGAAVHNALVIVVLGGRRGGVTQVQNRSSPLPASSDPWWVPPVPVGQVPHCPLTSLQSMFRSCPLTSSLTMMTS